MKISEAKVVGVGDMRIIRSSEGSSEIVKGSLGDGDEERIPTTVVFTVSPGSSWSSFYLLIIAVNVQPPSDCKNILR